MTANVSLLFPSIEDLWTFLIESHIAFIEIDKHKKILICRCTPEQLQLAINKYGATVIADENQLQ